jgi:hypothetical protein
LFFGSLPKDLTTLSLEKSKKKQSDFEKMVQINCNFIYTVYPDIYRKLMKDELDLNIMVRLVDILRQIEDNKTNQHDASVQFGQTLKEIFIDSAIKHGNNLDAEHSNKTIKKPDKKISWSEYKKQKTNNDNDLLNILY